MNSPPDSLYELLPVIHRMRDEEQGGALKALLAVLAKQTGVVEADIAALYENWFIETCAEWVVPYIGDLIGVRGLHSIPGAGFSQRARVANTLAYRRRKGTAAMLEQLAFDTTGWPAHAVEFFELLGWSQNYNHVRLHSPATVDIRRTDRLDLLGTAFEQTAHSVDVRHISRRRGRHNIPNVGLFLWRLQAFPLTGVTACPDLTPDCYRFSPLGLDLALFNSPQPETEITHLAEERNVPGPLRRRALYDELEAWRQALVDQRPLPSPVFFDAHPVFKIYLNGNLVPPENILICNLRPWHTPVATKSYLDAAGVSHPRPIDAAVDPEMGRLAFPAGTTVNSLLVDYAYGFSGDLGGGPYDRRNSAEESPPITWYAGVSSKLAPDNVKIFATLTAAIAAWKTQPSGTVGRIALLDSVTQVAATWDIEIPADSSLTIVAADLPKATPLELAAPTEQRPHLRGDITVKGTAAQPSGDLILDGLLLEGNLTVLSGQLSKLHVRHCTVMPGRGGLTVAAPNDELTVQLVRSITGPIALPDTVRTLEVTDCIVDDQGASALKAPGATADLQSSTFLGKVSARVIHASNSIFTELVHATLHQEGCVRFCFVPDGSDTAQRYRCQPDLALRSTDDAAEKALILKRLVPVFTSENYGDAGYAQLHREVPDEIRLGADDGAEMGAFYFLKQPQRETNLRASLDEYLRFGLEAGLIYAT